MIIGVPKEIKEQENRVGLLPYTAQVLTGKKHTVLVQKNAGVGSGYPDDAYVAAGAKIVDNAEDLFGQAEMIVKVKEPLKAEWGLLRKGQILFTYLHLAASKELTEALLKSGVTGVAYETIQVGNKLPLLEPMSEIAGRMSIVMGAYFLAKHKGGNGVLLGGVPGVLPGRVTVLGGGTAGVNAARMAVGLCADVTILEVDGERMRFLDLTMPNATTLYSNAAHLNELAADDRSADWRGPRSGSQSAETDHPRDVEKDEARQRAGRYCDRSGGVCGNFATDNALTPVYVEEGVTHYCVANMPAPMHAPPPRR